MAQVAGQLRRYAERLQDPSPVRAELLETAEYFAAGSDAATAAIRGT